MAEIRVARDQRDVVIDAGLGDQSVGQSRAQSPRQQSFVANDIDTSGCRA